MGEGPGVRAPAVAAEGPGVRAGVLRRWAGILSAYFSAQTLVQLLGIASGLLFINVMSVPEFALYSLATSVVTFFTFASDLGVTASLLHFYREATAGGEPFSPWYAAVASLRRAAFAVGGVAVAVALPAAAVARGFGLVESLAVTAVVLAGVWFQIGASLRVLALRLADRYGRSYRAELAGSGLRLALALALVATKMVTAWLGVLAGALGTALTSWLAGGADDAAAGTDLRPYRRRVLRYLAPTLPSALYFSVQGPLVVWLAATFGSTRSIAEVAALGRLSLVVGLFASLTGVVFLPRLSRITDDRLYRARYLQFGAALALVAVAVIGRSASRRRRPGRSRRSKRSTSRPTT